MELSFKIFGYLSSWHIIKNLYRTLGYWFRDMLNFYFLEKSLGKFLHHILCIIFQGKCFSCYILLTDQMSLPDWFYFLKYWAIFVLQLFAFRLRHPKFWTNQAVFHHEQKVKKLNNWEERLRWNKKHLSSFLKGFQLPKTVFSDLRLRL